MPNSALIPGGGEKPRSPRTITASDVPPAPDFLLVAGRTATERGLAAVVCTPFSGEAIDFKFGDAES
jgi:hypothetical protein